MNADGDTELRKRSDDLMQACQVARASLSKREVLSYRNRPGTAGLLFENYANMVLNRSIDLYDDATYLLQGNRTASACILARCVMETHAIGLHAFDQVTKKAGTGDLAAAGELVLKFINSSRFKQEEQKSLKSGKFNLEDFHFTEEARARMLDETAQSVHILNAMRFLFELELEQTKKKESFYELTYNGLSEWVHPSQSSLFHQYAVDTQLIKTSIGNVSLGETQRNSCVQGLSLILYINKLCSDMRELGSVMHDNEMQGS